MATLCYKDETFCYKEENHFSIMKSTYERSRQSLGKTEEKFCSKNSVVVLIFNIQSEIMSTISK